MTIQPFTLPITPARDLCKAIALKLLELDRKDWHRLESQLCLDCGKELQKIIHPTIGIEWVCSC